VTPLRWSRDNCAELYPYTLRVYGLRCRWSWSITAGTGHTIDYSTGDPCRTIAEARAACEAAFDRYIADLARSRGMAVRRRVAT
jgi:hypothetical protein